MNFLFSFAILAFVCQTSFAFTLPGDKEQILANFTETINKLQAEYKNFSLSCNDYFRKVSTYSKTQDLFFAELQNEKNDEIKALENKNGNGISADCDVIAHQEFEKISNDFSYYFENECPSVYKIWDNIKIIRNDYDQLIIPNIKGLLESIETLFEHCDQKEDPANSRDCMTFGIPLSQLGKVQIEVYNSALIRNLREYSTEIESCFANIRSKRTAELRNAEVMISNCINKI